MPHFIDWLTRNVVIVEITAYSDDNAYTIFETMNDRGLSLNTTEMLKGYVLSRIRNRNHRNEIDELWKREIKKLSDLGKNATQSFFQSWFRAKYAESIRPGNAGSENQDFEIIGTRLHNWFKENHVEHFKLNTSDEFYNFFKNKFPFYVKYHLAIWEARHAFDSDLPHIHYINNWGIAYSLQDPLLLSSVNFGDNHDEIIRKLDSVAKYVETFTVRRSINYKQFSQNAIKHTMFNLIKKIRNNNMVTLQDNLLLAVSDITQTWDGIENFRLHGMNRKFVKHLLCRVTSYVDKLVGKPLNYTDYATPEGKPFEIEHIWADKFSEHEDEFDQTSDFQNWRNNIGGLILLPKRTNQSFSSAKYDVKREHYIKENIYAQTLHKLYYEKNPNFLGSETVRLIGFKPHLEFRKSDIIERNKVVRNICEQIWGI